MPEGDTLFHYARRLRPLLVGETIERVDSRYLQRVRGLVGTTVTSVESIGKNLLVGFDDDTFLRVHLGMKGMIHRYAPGQRWREPFANMGWVLSTSAHEIVGFFPKELERFHLRERPRNLALSRLGPDLLREPLDFDEVTRRFRSIVDPKESIGIAIMDQRAACGIGNIYRCETLFARSRSPFDVVAEISDPELRELYETASELLRRNVKKNDFHPVTTTGANIRGMYVYGFHRKACLKCGGRIRCESQADLTREYVRSLWYCPQCQAPAVAA